MRLSTGAPLVLAVFAVSAVSTPTADSPSSPSINLARDLRADELPTTEAARLVARLKDSASKASRSARVHRRDGFDITWDDDGSGEKANDIASKLNKAAATSYNSNNIKQIKYPCTVEILDDSSQQCQVSEFAFQLKVLDAHREHGTTAADADNYLKTLNENDSDPQKKILYYAAKVVDDVMKNNGSSSSS